MFIHGPRMSIGVRFFSEYILRGKNVRLLIGIIMSLSALGEIVFNFGKITLFVSQHIIIHRYNYFYDKTAKIK